MERRLSAPPDISSAIGVHRLADWYSRRGVIARQSEIFPIRFERLPVAPPDYEYLRKLLKDHSGLDLSADKQYLIESRLLLLARKAGLSGISELVQKMRGGSTSFTTQVVEAMTINETFFFRDKVPFDHFFAIWSCPKSCGRAQVARAFGSGAPPARRVRNRIRWRCA